MTNPQRAPVFALFDHVTDTINDVKDTQTSLESINGLVQICSSFL